MPTRLAHFSATFLHSLNAFRTECVRVIRCIRSGLIMLIPILMLGSFALILFSLPVDDWQNFLHSFGGGVLNRFLHIVHGVTFGLISVYLSIFISQSFNVTRDLTRPSLPQIPVTALICFLLMIGFNVNDIPWKALGIHGMFTAIVTAVVSSLCMQALRGRLHRPRFFTEGADIWFSTAVQAMLPSFLTILLFALLNLSISEFLHFRSFQDFFVSELSLWFGAHTPSFGTALLYTFTSTLLWFFGIHGSNLLEGSLQHIFSLDIAAGMLASGSAYPHIFTKSFFDVFLSMGGCGQALALFFAILLFSRNKGSRKLAFIALLPLFFNINELLIFGLPVVLNPYLFIPFLGAPLLTTLTSYFAIDIGLVSPAVFNVHWTTPVIWGGYAATHSATGALLQVFNLMLCIGLYAPFVRLYDRQKTRLAAEQVNNLTSTLLEAQEQGTPVFLLGMRGDPGTLARMLAGDLLHALKKNELELHFQPQFDADDHYVGSEALLRWSHPGFGRIAPPLVVRLAEEMRQIGLLERWIFRQAARRSMELRARGLPSQISVNVTGATLYDPDFAAFLHALIAQGLAPRDIHIELTEQSPLLSSSDSRELFHSYRDMGFSFAIDDFSMGHTSLKYLQDDDFEMVKLDGSLVKDLHNARCREIVTSIVSLARTLHFEVLAEYVETREDQKMLEAIGVRLYQGYLYSPALKFEDLLGLLEKEAEKKSGGTA